MGTETTAEPGPAASPDPVARPEPAPEPEPAADGPFSHPRWRPDGSTVRVDSVPVTYAWQYRSPVLRAALSDEDGAHLGWVWTDGHEAAGWSEPAAAPSGFEEGAARVRAGAHVWAALRDAKGRDEPASAALRPHLYAPYQLGAPQSADRPDAPEPRP
ncbi:hypothetical protein DEF23_23730 [Marinitenerispora sediminis]|uniref:Uncharacterized protein n=1 Tax=Marinitenerispora sediminis TaxID=1931232 RepID=A0A368SY17_9ACTN|nr:hypothetical protein DEF24_26175 [Marinitenerispora sediminis]RCV49381.1 hypothetical protein DEF23_23730 [Marinitenerispora sediminis]RCV50039.1 hypothetical protein DEF28_19160 [Marinitenerispora sediminis]